MTLQPSSSIALLAIRLASVVIGVAALLLGCLGLIFCFYFLESRDWDAYWVLRIGRYLTLVLGVPSVAFLFLRRAHVSPRVCLLAATVLSCVFQIPFPQFGIEMWAL